LFFSISLPIGSTIADIIAFGNSFLKALITGVLIRTSPINPHNIIAIVFISLWNITLKKKIEEKTAQLIESEKQFRGFFEQSLIPYLLIDKGKFIDCNQAAVNFIQAKSKKDLLVNIDNLSPKYQPDGILSVEKAKKLVNEVFKTGEIKTFEWVLKSFTGKTFWAYINYLWYLIKTGTLYWLLGWI